MVASLESLQTELLALILELVDDESPTTTKAAACVNRHFCNTSKLVAHRRKLIDARDGDLSASVDRWLNNTSILTGLRHLEVGKYHSRGVPMTVDYACIAGLISSISNLKSLIWSTPSSIREDVITSLQTHHPKAHLKILDFHRPSENGEIALCNSPALAFIRATLHLPTDEAAFRRIVACAPNLKVASLVYFNPMGIDSGQVDAESEKTFTHKKPNSSIRTLTLDGYRMNKRTLQEWGRFVDMSEIQNLKWTRGVPDISYFEAAPGILANLKHVSLNLNFNHRLDFAAAVSNYLETCAPLKSISLWSWMRIVSLSTILGRHGKTLEALQLHERETTHWTERRGILSAEDIKSISDSCPQLQDLTFDMDRNSDIEFVVEGEENEQTLRRLSEFESQLDRVQLYFDLGLMSLIGLTEDESDDDEVEEEAGETQAIQDRQNRLKKQKRHPMVVIPSSEEMIRGNLVELWLTIYDEKRGPRMLDVKIGEWERKAGWGVEQGKKSMWRVSPPVRDDGEDAGVEGCIIKCIGGPWAEGGPGVHHDSEQM